MSAQLEPGDVSIRVEAAAFGVRDLAMIGRGHAVPGGGAVGLVIGAGIAAGEWLDRRVVAPRLGPCGECRFCRRGAVAGCPDRRELGVDRPGALADEVVVRARWLAPADGELEVDAPAGAICGDDGLVAYGLYCRVGVAAGDPVVCVGSGPRTALVAQIARAKGAVVAEVTAVDQVEGDQFADRPWQVFALDGGSLGAVPPGSSVALAGGASIDLAATRSGGLSIATGEHGHPDLLGELVALAARQQIDPAAVAEPIDGDIASAAAEVIGRGRIPISRPSRGR